MAARRAALTEHIATLRSALRVLSEVREQNVSLAPPSPYAPAAPPQQQQHPAPAPVRVFSKVVALEERQQAQAQALPREVPLKSALAPPARAQRRSTGSTAPPEVTLPGLST